MKKHFQKFLSPILASATAIVLLFSAVVAEEGKMPVTSSSEKALENYWKGINLTDKLRFPDARQFFETAVAEDPNFAVAYLNLGFTVASNKGFFENLEEAKSVMDKASEAERMWILGVEAGAVGNPQKQFGLYKSLVENYPNDERARMLLGNYYFGQQEYGLAVKQYNSAANVAPDLSQIYNQLGYSQRFLKKYDEAEKAFQKYIELIPDDPNPFDSYAELLLKIGRFDESIVQYRKALDIDQTFAASYFGIATCNNFLGNHAEARKTAQELYDNAVNDGQRRAAHFTKATSYIDEGDLDNAIAEFKKQMAFARKINDAGNISGDLALIAYLLLQQNKADEALTNYKKAMDVVQESGLSDDFKKNNRLGFLFNKTLVALKKGDLTKAKSNQMEYAAQAKANQSRFQIWASHQLAGMIALEEKDYKSAVAELAQANLQNTYNLYRMALAYEGLGDKENAKRYCEETVKYNQLGAINYGLVRHKAKKMLAAM